MITPNLRVSYVGIYAARGGKEGVLAYKYINQWGYDAHDKHEHPLLGYPLVPNTRTTGIVHPRTILSYFIAVGRAERSAQNVNVLFFSFLQRSR